MSDWRKDKRVCHCGNSPSVKVNAIALRHAETLPGIGSREAGTKPRPLR
jgi:hypothetical protein